MLDSRHTVCSDPGVFNVQNTLCYPHQTYEEKSLTFLIDYFLIVFWVRSLSCPFFTVCTLCVEFLCVCVFVCASIYIITLHLCRCTLLCTVLILGNFFRPLMKFLRITNLHCINFQKKQRFWRTLCFLTWEKSLNKNLMMSRGDGIK